MIAGHERLSYRELDRRAGRLASSLRRLGVGPEVPVGIFCERSAAMVVGLLAVLKTDGAYLPLDPAYPAVRLHFILEDVEPPVVLTSTRLRQRLPTATSTRLLCLDAAEDAVASPRPRPAARSAAAGNLAYAIYTSGPTGRAKAVGIEHRSAVHLMRWTREVFSPQELRGVLASTSTCFDLSVFELFVPLSRGGTVILAENALALEPTIGRPLPGTEAQVVGPGLEPVSRGEVGELVLGGGGLARGYLNRPGLTAERFVPDPWCGPRRRLYRTGDLVRRRPDGNLEFLGRIDHQVKIRGSRIELGEIEVGEEAAGRQAREKRLAGEQAKFDTKQATLSTAKQALLAKWMRKGVKPPDAPAGIPRRPDAGPAELSFAQQRLWFLDQFEPGTPTYNIPNAVRLRGRLDRGALRRSLHEIVERHEVLRTTFRRLAGTPDRADAAERVTPHHVLLFNVHHIVFDGWSTEVFLHELTALCRALVAGDPSPLAELEVQYADFALWQRRWLRDEVLERQLRYWREQLADLPVLELGTDRPRPAVQTFAGATESFRLEAALGRELHRLARANGLTLFMTLLAAVSALLARYSGQGEVAVGSPVANRNHAEIEPLMGFFVNTLVLRGSLRDDPTVGELLARTREVVLDAHAHQDLPFEKLVEELDPERDPSHNPLVQVLLVLQNASTTIRELAPGVEVRIGGAATGTAKFDLSLAVEETKGGFSPAAVRRKRRLGAVLGPLSDLSPSNGGLLGAVEYNTDLFDRSTVRRLTAHFATLLEGITADPDTEISRLPLLAVGERHQLVAEWNDGAVRYPEKACVRQLFAAQVERTPEAVAVAAGDSYLSYRELDLRARRLAWQLRSLGVGPEVRVGVFSERSPAMITGLVAVLKAGGAYLPMDPATPPERLAFMLEDAGAKVLLIGEALRERLGEFRVPMVSLDGEAYADQGPEDPTTGVGSERLAYVIFTSGSTGRPKASELEHRGLVNLVSWHQRIYRVAPGVHATQLAGPGFDAAVWELWPYLTAGGTIHLPDQEIVLAPARLAEWLTAQGIHLAFLPTPLAEAVLADVFLRELELLYRGLTPPALPLQYPTSRSGSGSGCAARSSIASSPTGAGSWPDCRSWSCPVTGRGRRCRAT
ncbi:MAG: AMP-binding protein, partial [bacterium]|nr:AMP-binding protein [bacterium]